MISARLAARRSEERGGRGCGGQNKKFLFSKLKKRKDLWVQVPSCEQITTDPFYHLAQLITDLCLEHPESQPIRGSLIPVSTLLRASQ